MRSLGTNQCGGSAHHITTSERDAARGVLCAPALLTCGAVRCAGGAALRDCGGTQLRRRLKAVRWPTAIFLPHMQATLTTGDAFCARSQPSRIVAHVSGQVPVDRTRGVTYAWCFSLVSAPSCKAAASFDLSRDFSVRENQIEGLLDGSSLCLSLLLPSSSRARAPLCVSPRPHRHR